jgi:hypothetical protein
MAADPPSDGSDFWAHGRIDMGYVFRSVSPSGAPDEIDHDLYQDVFLEGGKGPVRAEVSGRLHEDVDGKQPQGSYFRDVYDTWDEAVVGLLYTGFVELLDQGPIASARAGRQYYENGVDVRFDGGLVESKPLGDAVKLFAYGGLPANLYASSVTGCWLAGGAAECIAVPRTVIRADYVHVRDFRGDPVAALSSPAGVPRDGHGDDDLWVLTVTHQLIPDLRLYGRASTFDGRSSRVEGDVFFQDAGLDLSAHGRYVGQFGNYNDLSVQFAPYNEQMGAYEPYQEIYLDARKGMFEKLSLAAGFALRALQHARDEGPFNHEFWRAFAMADVTDLPWDGFTISMTGDWYLSDVKDEYYELSGSVSQRVGPITASIGSLYSLYSFDQFFLTERQNVRTFYGNVDWRLTKWLLARAEYSYDEDDKENYHVVRFNVRVTF